MQDDWTILLISIVIKEVCLVFRPSATHMQRLREKVQVSAEG
jgi:hypothetical protein